MKDPTENAINNAVEAIDQTLDVLAQGREDRDRETSLMKAVAVTIGWRKAV